MFIVLLQNLEIRYGALQKNNDYNNKQAVDQAYREYMREMDNQSRPGIKALIIVTFLVKVWINNLTLALKYIKANQQLTSLI